MMGELVRDNQPCPNCTSSDGYHVYREDDGALVGYCYVCSETIVEDRGTGEVVDFKPKHQEVTPIPEGKYMAIPSRGLTEATCKRMDISVVRQNGKEYHVYGYYTTDDGKKVKAKVRGLPKVFNPREDPACGPKGATKTAALFGVQSFNPAPHESVTICEGELDAASVYEMTGKPAVSVSSSVSALKDVQAEYEWLNKFKEVLICMDNDEAGRKAEEKLKDLFPGKTKIVRLQHHNDPNDYLVKGDKQAFITEWRNAQTVKVDGVVTGIDALLELAIEEPAKGISLIWPELTKITRGVRLGEVWVLGGGTGMGKSEFCKEISFGLMKDHKEKVGMIMFEETPARTVQCLMGKELNTRYYLEDVDTPSEPDLRSAAEELAPYLSITTKLKTEWDQVVAKIKYMVNGLGIKYIFLDHLTAVGEGKSGDVNSTLHMVMESLSHLAVSYNCTFFCISHLNRTGNKEFTEGARVTLNSFYGSSAIQQWANYAFGFEGDQRGEEIPDNHRILRCLKDRNAGDGGGKKVILAYNPDTGRLLEMDEEENAFTQGED